MPVYFSCAKCSGTFDPAFTYCPICDGEKMEEIEQLRAELSFQQNAHRQAQEALLAQGSELAASLAENLRLRKALENCRLLAARHRKEEWASHVLRFCDDAGVSGKVLRHNPPGDCTDWKVIK